MAQKRKRRAARRREVTVADMVFMDLGIGPHRRAKRKPRWVQRALKVRRRRVRHHLRVQGAHKGALHRQLGIPSGNKITMKRLRAAHKEAKFELRHAENAREKKAARTFLGRVQFAINRHKFKHR